MPTMIKAGSYSRLSIFESCPHRAELAYILKIAEPERPPLSNGKEYANDRGSRVHDCAENYVKNKKGFEKLILELYSFAEEIEILHSIYRSDPSRILMEKMWYFDNSWTSLPHDIEFWDKRIWMRIMLDVAVFSTCGTKVLVIDYKTGRRYGNEVKHAQQTQLYALAIALRYPEVEEIVTELWYPDQNETATVTYKRKQILRFLENWNNRMVKMTTAVQFPPKANGFTCNFCPFKTGLMGRNGPEGTGHCDLNP